MSFAVRDALKQAAVLNNDSQQQLFTNVALFPYFLIAFNEYVEMLQENNIPVINKVSATYTLTTAMTDIGGSSGLTLPDDFIEIVAVYERTAGSNDDFIPVGRRDFLPLTSIKTALLGVYAWQDQIIKFIGATGNREIKLEYLSDTTQQIINENSVCTLLNSQNTLQYRTAGLAARFIGENPTRADELDGFASTAFERTTNVSIKSKQIMPARRRPFRSRTKSRW